MGLRVTVLTDFNVLAIENGQRYFGNKQSQSPINCLSLRRCYNEPSRKSLPKQTTYYHQDCHQRVWTTVATFLEHNVKVFVGKTTEAESTLMPASRSWIRDMANEMGNNLDDHTVVLFLNMPALGVVGALKQSFIINYVSNVLSDWPVNGICFVVHPNRAGQENRSSPRELIFLFPAK